MHEPGVNNQKALKWVQSHEGFDAAEIKWDPWVEHYIEVEKGDMGNDEFVAISSYCFNLFDTPMMAREWA